MKYKEASGGLLAPQWLSFASPGLPTPLQRPPYAGLAPARSVLISPIRDSPTSFKILLQFPVICETNVLGARDSIV